MYLQRGRSCRSPKLVLHYYYYYQMSHDVSFWVARSSVSYIIMCVKSFQKYSRLQWIMHHIREKIGPTGSAAYSSVRMKYIHNNNNYYYNVIVVNQRV